MARFRHRIAPAADAELYTVAGDAAGQTAQLLLHADPRGLRVRVYDCARDPAAARALRARLGPAAAAGAAALPVAFVDGRRVGGLAALRTALRVGAVVYHSAPPPTA